MKKIRNPVMDKLRAKKRAIGKKWGFRHIRYFILMRDFHRFDSPFISGVLSFDVPDVEVEDRINEKMDRVWNGTD